MNRAENHKLSHRVTPFHGLSFKRFGWRSGLVQMLMVLFFALIGAKQASAHTATNDYTLSCIWNDSLSAKGWETGPTSYVSCSADMVATARPFHNTAAAFTYDCLPLDDSLSPGYINEGGWNLFGLIQRKEIDFVHQCLYGGGYHTNVVDREISSCPSFHHAVVTGTDITNFSCAQDPNMAPTISGSSTYSAVLGQAFTDVGFFGLDIDRHPSDILVYVEFNFPSWLDMNSSSGFLSGTPTVVGTQCATAQVTDGAAWASKDFCITVTNPNNSPTISDFTWDPVPARTGATTLFTAVASDPDGDPITYSWSFGDGSGAGRVTDHVYSVANTYSVVLTVTDNKGASATLTKTVQVIANSAPSAVGFSWAPERPDPLTDAVSFVGTAFDANGDAMSTIWSVDDGTITPLTLNGFSFQHVFLTSGPHVVSLSVLDDWGGNTTHSESVYVDTPTVVSGITKTPSDPTTAQEVTFSVTANDPDPGDTPLTYDWVIVDALSGALITDPVASASSSLTHTFAAGGTYYAVVNAITARGDISDPSDLTFTIAQNVPPTASLVVTPSLVFAGQDNVLVDASGSSDLNTGDQSALVFIYEVTAAPAGAATGVLPSPTDWESFTYLFEKPGNYDLKVYVSDGKSAAVTATAHVTALEAGMCPAYDNGTDPISHANGNSFETEVDYVGTGPLPLEFVRYYNSAAPAGTALGANWRHTYARSVSRTENIARVYRADGSIIPYSLVNNVWTTASSVPMKLEEIAGGWRYTDANNTVENFDTTGRLVSISNLAGQLLSLAYNASGQLSQVTDSFGRTLKFAYFTTTGPLRTVTDPNNRDITYAYNAQNNVNKVTYADTTTRTYVYGNTSFPTALTGILDENNQSFLELGYDAQGRAWYSQHAGGADRTELNYNIPAITVNGKTYSGTEITDALGKKRTFYWRSENGIYQTRQYNTGDAKCTTCLNSFKSATFDVNGNPDTQTDFTGSVTDFDYNNRGLEIQRIEAVGSIDQRIIKTEWHDTYRLPTCVIAPGRTTVLAYSANGQLSSRTEVDTTLLTQFPTEESKRCVNINLADTLLNKRAWSYAYYATGVMKGLVQTIDGPRTDVTDVTTYEYYTDAEIYKGSVKKITDALTRVTEFLTYDTHGRPLTLKDPNGLITKFEYDLRGRLRFRREGTDLAGYEVTEYRYDNAGNVDQVIAPNGAFINYDYDNAHRLTDIRDQLNNHIHYTLDALGNRLQVDVYDPLNTLVRAHTNTYWNTNHLNESKDTANPSLGVAPGVTKFIKADSTEGYDADGNLSDILDAENRRTHYDYDSLSRVKETLDAKLGKTKYTYDAHNRIKTVTDPNNIVTTYTYDGLGNLRNIDSKDAGLTQLTKYDGAGNPTERIDARSKKTTYVYDALNRIDLVTYNNNTTADYVYDLGVNGIGRLSSITDSSGTTSYTYDLHGRVNTKTQTVGGKSFAMTYTYDTAGQIDTIKYPSNKTVKYNYTNGVVSSLNVLGGAVLASSMAYEPFGPLSRWNFGNAAAVARTYDKDGRMRSYTLGTGSRTLDYYPSGNLFHIKDLSNSANDQTLGYDELYRLTSYSGLGRSYGYQYDANGNRINATIDGVLSAYTTVPATNRLNATSPVATAYGYDAAGNVTSDGKHTYVYDDRGRMASIDSSAATYTINSLGQRIKKVVNVAVQPGDANGDGLINASDRPATINAILGTATAPGNADCNGDTQFTAQDLVCLNTLIASGASTNGTTHYAYDEGGHLRGEYDANGTAIQEYVWFGDLPLTVLKGTAVYNIYTDHLNTPRLIANQSNVAQWRWEGEPFGASAANEDVDGDGTKFNFNLRFAGQYFDAESGLHYNVNRDYDPAVGRYMESDPIGLNGGLNLYAYVRGNPISAADMSGLWSPEAHDALIQDAFEGLLPQSDIDRLKASGREFDSRTQSTGESNLHSMRQRGQSVTDAIRQRDEFINTAILAVREGTNREERLELFGQLIHPIMDSFSPEHRDEDGNPKVWNPAWPFGHSPTEWLGDETKSDITDDIYKQVTEALICAYNKAFAYTQ